MNSSWAVARGTIVTAALATTLALAASGAGTAAGLLFHSADFTILDAGSGKVIGAVHYDVDDSRPGIEVVTGMARYKSGDYDVERDEFLTDLSSRLPVMSAYEHRFFKPDHSPFLESAVDFESGAARCVSYSEGHPVVMNKTLTVPPDSYAGAAIMLPLQQSLRERAEGAIVMHDFACIPGPHLLKIEARAEQPAPWEYLSGEVVRINITPDFGLLDYVIAPFLPEMHAWFSPSDDFRFVGAEFARYYKGPTVILRRTDGGLAHTKKGQNSGK